MTTTKAGTACIMLMILTACGSGSVYVPKPAPFVEVRTEMHNDELQAVQDEPSYGDPRNAPALNLINAHWLYARARKNHALHPTYYGPGTGRGVLVAVHDDGMDHTHPQFAGRVDERSVLTWPLRDREHAVQGVAQLTGSEVQGIAAYPNLNLEGESPYYIIDPDTEEYIDKVFIVRRPDGTERIAPFRGYFEYDEDGELLSSRGSQIFHGTAVGCLIACASGSDYFHQGLAHQADILVHALDYSVWLGPRPEELIEFSTDIDDGTAAWAAHDALRAGEISFFTRSGAHVVNGSFGFMDGSIDRASRYDEARLRAAFPLQIAAFAQRDTDPADRTIFVRSAGNYHGRCDYTVGDCERGDDGRLVENDAPFDASSPAPIAGMPAYISEMRGHFVAAAAVNIDGSGIASFSNRCGIAADWCLAAPGTTPRDDEDRRTPGIGYLLAVAGIFGQLDDPTASAIETTSRPFGGTSAAAPYISGGIALLIDYFNGRLGNTEIVARMFATANKTGIYADRSIYGQGLLDLKAATEPFGNARIVTGQTLSGRAALLAASRIYTSPAFGDAWQRALADQTLMSFDDLDTPFPVAMDSLLRPPQPWSGIAPHLAPHKGGAYSAGRSQYLQHQQLDDTLSWAYSGGIHPGYAAAPQMAAMGPLGAALLAPWPALARDSFGSALGYGGLQLAAWAGQGSSGAERRAHNQGWMLSMGDAKARLELGYMDERGALDSSGGGALGLGSGSTWFVGGRMQRNMGSGWRAHLAAWAGVTDAAGDGVIGNLQGLTSSSASAAITRDLHGGTLGLLIHQPLRIEQGHVQLQWIADRDRYRNIYQRASRIDLSPSGRELELAIHYSRATPAGALALAISSVRDPGHSTGSDLRAGIRWDARF